MSINNPLRYPGAKSKLVPYIEKLIKSEGLTGCTLYEPMLEVPPLHSLYLTQGLYPKAIINELDPLIYCFGFRL